MRAHGLQRPFHLLQILTWVLFPMFLLDFYLVLIPLLLPSTTLMVACAVYTLAAAASCFAVGLASCPSVSVTLQVTAICIHIVLGLIRVTRESTPTSFNYQLVCRALFSYPYKTPHANSL